MVVNSSSIGMESARKYTSVRMDAYFYSAKGSVGGNIGNIGIGVGNNGEMKTKKSTDNGAAGSFQSSMTNLMDRFEQMRVRSTVNDKQEQDSISRIKLQCINYLIQILFGNDKKKKDALSDEATDASANASAEDAAPVMTLVGTYGEMHYYGEAEETAFSTEGTVVTADGRELSFNLSLSMSRSFEQQYMASHEVMQEMCDPLVINLDTDIASVSDQKFLFDLDADGELDEISSLDASSGYLALDLNEDGKINDGSELFGTKSGDGFRDLAKYDSDKNGWIDEADDIWSKLLIYSQGNDGKQQLYGLSEKGVGAIYLGNVDTDYSLNSAATNQVNAAIRKTGIFLYENGNVGTVQHLDLAK